METSFNTARAEDMIRNVFHNVRFETIQHLILRDTLEQARIFRNTETNTRISILRGKCRSLYLFITFLAQSNLNRINPKKYWKPLLNTHHAEAFM